MYLFRNIGTNEALPNGSCEAKQVDIWEVNEEEVLSKASIWLAWEKSSLNEMQYPYFRPSTINQCSEWNVNWGKLLWIISSLRIQEGAHKTVVKVPALYAYSKLYQVVVVSKMPMRERKRARRRWSKFIRSVPVWHFPKPLKTNPLVRFMAGISFAKIHLTSYYKKK